MQLQRYTLREGQNLVPFGAFSKVPNYDFDWYVGESGRLGISGKASTEAREFLDGILHTSEVLLLHRSESRPRISREGNNLATMWGLNTRENSSPELVSKLIELLGSEQGAHAYPTAERAGADHRPILAFSADAPPLEAYAEVAPMPVKYG